MRLLWLAEDCRAAGLKVVELPGWQARGAEFPQIPNTVVCHHTASATAAKGDLPTKQILIDGRADLPGPLCQIGLGRNGTVYVVASGKANHAGPGAWAGVSQSIRTLGIEAENPGDGSPWPAKQYDAYVALCAVLARGLGVGAERVCGHREWALPAGRKSDPAFDMDRFRVEVARKLSTFLHPKPAPTTGDDMPLTDEDVERIAKRVKQLVAQDLAVVLHGTKDGTHPYSIDSIAKAVGVKP